MKIDMEYNSQKEDLIIPEYGRNVQELVAHAKTIENDDFRQAFVEKIVDLMLQMSPQSRNMDDYRDRLWRHVFRIANYDLKVRTPSGEVPTAEQATKKPDPVEYPVVEAQYRHYGHNVQTLIKKAIEMGPGPMQDEFVAVIGAYMKLAYRTWNKEHYISDEIIKADLKALSKGELVIDENIPIDNLDAGQAPVSTSGPGPRRRTGGKRPNNGGSFSKGRHGKGKKRK